MASDESIFEGIDLEGMTLSEISAYQKQKISTLLDLNQSIIKVAREQAAAWEVIGSSYLNCYEIALELRESCAVAARVAADITGDIISSEFGLVQLGPEDDDEDSDD